VIVQGTVNGTSVVAASIIDQTKPASATTNSVKTPQSHLGFFSSIGQSLLHFFGL